MPVSSGIAHVQDQLLRLLGNSSEGRAQLLTHLLRRDPREATSYWLQLIVAIGIATLGLVVGSTAVVIGAMLIAPLMGPILGLAMGLAAGSPFLVLRSGGRIVLSVLCAILGAASITQLLPFHELNAEISARTAPTVLDLVTAAFCALAGVYSSLRPGSDTAATAAGTSIGISLVPPLCASGYGLGTLSSPVAGGAALLFLTNLVAIVVVGTVAFVAVGFNRVGIVELERNELEHDGSGAPIARALARRLSKLFSSRWGPALRFLMPFVLLGAVYLPLRRALDQVAWEVKVRASVRKSLAGAAARLIESRVRIERRTVEVVAVLLGTTQEADALQRQLSSVLHGFSGAVPRLEVMAVPDASAFAGLESSLAARSISAPARAPTNKEQLNATVDRIRTAVLELWPAAAVGPALAIDIGTERVGPLRVRVVHLGPPLSADGDESLRSALKSRIERATELVDVAVPNGTIDREDGDLLFAARVSAGIQATASIPEVHLCVVRPASPQTLMRRSEREGAKAVDALVAEHPRVTIATGTKWSAEFKAGSCSPEQSSKATQTGEGRTGP